MKIENFFPLPIRRIHQGLQGKPDRGQSAARKHGIPGNRVVERESFVDEKLQELQDRIHFDGVWIDMNEPSKFVHGSATGDKRCTCLHSSAHTSHA